ncbi:MAG: helix-turn-helix transcriptional regulator [Dehalococcoidia bacterium]
MASLRRRGRPPYPDFLTPSEQRVLELIRRGKTNSEIANELAISVPGVKYHVTNMLGKTGASDRTDLANWKPSRSSSAALGILGRFSAWKLAAAGSVVVTCSVVAVAAFADPPEDKHAIVDNVVAPTALPAQSALSAGLLVQVLDVETDATQTVLKLRISGRESEGEGIMPAQQIILIDDTGHVVPNTRGSAAPTDARLLTWEFPPLSLSSTRFNLRITGLQLVNRVKGSMKSVDGTWTIPVSLSGPVIPSQPVSFPTESQLSGVVPIFLDSVDVGPDSVLITGHYGDLGMEEVPAANLAVELRQGFDAYSPINLRFGFGEHREKFEMRFNALHGEATLAIRVDAGLSNDQVDPTAVASLATKVATPGEAEFALTLP